MRYSWSHCLAILCLAAPAGAQVKETIVVTEPDRDGLVDLVGPDPRAIDGAEALDNPAFATTVRIDNRELENPDVASVLAETVGVSVRSLGGLGSFSSLSVRGAAPGHTAVFVDG